MKKKTNDKTAAGKRQLLLSREKIRELQAHELQGAAGGDGDAFCEHFTNTGGGCGQRGTGAC